MKGDACRHCHAEIPSDKPLSAFRRHSQNPVCKLESNSNSNSVELRLLSFVGPTIVNFYSDYEVTSAIMVAFLASRVIVNV